MYRYAYNINLGESQFYLTHQIFIHDEPRIFIIVNGHQDSSLNARGSELVLDLLKTHIDPSNDFFFEHFRYLIILANNKLFEYAAENEAVGRIVCDVLIIIIQDGYAFIGFVGDIYLFSFQSANLLRLIPRATPFYLFQESSLNTFLPSSSQGIGLAIHDLKDVDFVGWTKVAIKTKDALLYCNKNLYLTHGEVGIKASIERNLGNRTRVVKDLTINSHQGNLRNHVINLFIEGSEFPYSYRVYLRRRELYDTSPKNWT